MKRLSLPTFITLVKNAGIKLDDNTKKMLSTEYANYIEPEITRTDPRVFIIRCLIAKGYTVADVTRRLGIKRYQVYTALKSRKNIKNDIDWNPDKLQESKEYNSMTWNSDEFEEITSKPNIDGLFDYSKLREFEDVLVV